MKKLLLSTVVTCVTCATLAAVASASYADINPAMKDSKYCQDSGAADPLCMGPESMAMRVKMMEMTKENAMANREKYCSGGGASDPICDEKMMKDTTGY